MTTTTTMQGVMDALKATGLAVYEAYQPSEIEVVINKTASLLLTRGFNILGWEAVIEPSDGDQIPQKDGPGADAPAADVVVWVKGLINEFTS